MDHLAVTPHAQLSASRTRQQHHAARRARGAFYTPAWLARHMAARVFRHVTQSRPRVLDLACGDGALLRQALDLLATRNNTPCTVASRLELVHSCIRGIDINAEAVAAARRNLAAWILGDDASPPQHLWEETSAAIAHCIVNGDALEMQHVADSADVILGNPPYLSIRQLHQTHGAGYVQRLRERYTCAAGAFDSYVLFVEKAQQLLRAGGCCTMITPGRLADMEYATRCRELLLSGTLHQIDDLSSVPALFPGVSVYAHIYTWQKHRPAKKHLTAVSEFVTAGRKPQPGRTHFIPQQALSSAGFAVHRQAALLEGVSTAPLGECAAVHCGAAGFSAQLLAGELREASSLPAAEDALPFIVSGNIDRYQIKTGNVRFMKRKFQEPMLPASSSYFNAARRRLYQQPKIVVAGMTRRLEAAFAPQPLAIGVQTYAVKPQRIDNWLLLGLLNSRLVSHWFASRFAARRLAGGFLAINKSQLEQIPLPAAAFSDDPRHVHLQQQIAGHAQELHRGEPVAAAACSDTSLSQESAERKLDALVYQLYGLADSDIAAVESCDLPPAVKGGSY